MTFTQSSRLQLAVFAGALLCATTALSGYARADVTLFKSDGWEFYTNGRINAFFSYGRGDVIPAPRQDPNGAMGMEKIPAGGGLDVGPDTLPPDAGCTPSPMMGCPQKFISMRVRSGFVPNVLGFGLNRVINDNWIMRAYFAVWATIDTPGMRKETQVYADARETWGKLESKKYGTFTVGKALDLFSRGAVQNDFMYLHGYGLGFPGNISDVGPTAGLIGYGVLASFFSAGMTYTTPRLAGLELTAGVYDPTPLPGSYEATRDPRAEGELTYDGDWGLVKLHLFGNGGYQNFYNSASNLTTSGYGVGYGGRFEAGPFHVGAAGHWGRGLGLGYAFSSGDVNVSASTRELRYFTGYSVFAQYKLGRVDLNAGYGLSQVDLLESDKDMLTSLPKQWAASAAVVFHATENVHLDIDYIHARTDWTLGEKQNIDFINTGLVITW